MANMISQNTARAQDAAVNEVSLEHRLGQSGFDLNVTEATDVSRGVTFSRFSSPPNEATGITPDVWWLGIHHRKSRADLQEWDKRLENCTALPGYLILVAPSTEYRVSIRDHVDNSSVFIEKDLVQQLLPEAYHNRAPFEALPCSFFRSPLILEISAQLGRVQNSIHGGGQLYVEALTSALLMDLARVAEDKEAVTFRKSRGADLTPQHMRNLNEFIDEHSFSSIKTQDLAKVVGMHPSSFQRSFKAVTKTTPYQYVLDRRVDQARQMIETSQLSLAQIAFQCGFSSQSHMTDVFRVRIGATPGELR